MNTDTPSTSYNAYNKFLNPLPPSERHIGPNMWTAPMLSVSL